MNVRLSSLVALRCGLRSNTYPKSLFSFSSAALRIFIIGLPETHHFYCCCRGIEREKAGKKNTLNVFAADNPPTKHEVHFVVLFSHLFSSSVNSPGPDTKRSHKIEFHSDCVMMARFSPLFLLYSRRQFRQCFISISLSLRTLFTGREESSGDAKAIGRATDESRTGTYLIWNAAMPMIITVCAGKPINSTFIKKNSKMKKNISLNGKRVFRFQHVSVALSRDATAKGETERLAKNDISRWFTLIFANAVWN